MIKIDYLKEKEKLEDLNEKYFEEFGTDERKEAFTKLNLSNSIFKDISLKHILTCDFENLKKRKDEIEENFLKCCYDAKFVDDVKKQISSYKNDNTKDESQLLTNLKTKVENNTINFNGLQEPKEKALILKIAFEPLKEIFNYTDVQPKLSTFFELLFLQQSLVQFEESRHSDLIIHFFQHYLKNAKWNRMIFRTY